MADNFGRELGLSAAALPSAQVNHAYLGDGYGIPNKEVFTTLMTAARQEGLLLDPVYSGKAFMGLIDQTNIGAFSDHEDVVFIHTGGAQSLNVYEAGIYAELAHSRSG